MALSARRKGRGFHRRDGVFIRGLEPLEPRVEDADGARDALERGVGFRIELMADGYGAQHAGDAAVVFVDVRFEEREAFGVIVEGFLKVGSLGVDVAEDFVDVGEVDGVAAGGIAVEVVHLRLVDEPRALDHLPREFHVVLLRAFLLLALLGVGIIRRGSVGVLGARIVGVVVVADVLALVGCVVRGGVGFLLGVRGFLRARPEDGVLVLRLVEEGASVLVVRLRGLDGILAEGGGAELEALAEELDGIIHLVGLDLGDALVEQRGRLGRGLLLVNRRHLACFLFQRLAVRSAGAWRTAVVWSRVLGSRQRAPGVRSRGVSSRRAGLRPARA